MVHLYLFTENHCVEWYVSNIPDREDLVQAHDWRQDI